MSRTIVINKSIIFIIILSFILGFGVLFFTEHFGKMSAEYRPVRYETDYGYREDTPMETPLNTILYYTPYGSLVKTGGNGFTLYEMQYSNVGLGKYKNKIYYIIEGTKKDYLFGILYSVIFLIIIIFFKSFKIKIK